MITQDRAFKFKLLSEQFGQMHLVDTEKIVGYDNKAKF